MSKSAALDFKGEHHRPQPRSIAHCAVPAFLRSLFAVAQQPDSPYKLHIYNSIADVKNTIEQLTPGGIPTDMEPALLAAMEASLPDVGFRYAVIYMNGTPVLFASLQLYTLTTRNFVLQKNKTFVKGILRFLLGLKKVRIVILGNALRNETVSYLYAPSAFTPTEAIEAVAAVAEKIADAENATAIILKDIAGDSTQLADAGYQAPWPDSAMEMAIRPEWKTITHYTAALNRKYKTRANKALAAAKELEIRPLTEEEVTQMQPDIFRLFTNVTNNQPFVLTHQGANHFSALKTALNDRFEVLGFFHQGTLIAFSAAFVADGVYEVYYVGIDYEQNNRFQLYFNLLFSVLDRAIALGKPLLKLGRTSYDAKASLGAAPRPLPYLMKPMNIPGFVLQWFSCYFSSLEDGQWRLRNPLKAE